MFCERHRRAIVEKGDSVHANYTADPAGLLVCVCKGKCGEVVWVRCR